MDQELALLIMLVPTHIRTAGGVIRRVVVPTLSARAESWSASHVLGMGDEKQLGYSLPPILQFKNARIQRIEKK